MYYNNKKLIIPETINELHKTILKTSNPVFFAGGTHLMKSHCLYPSNPDQTIISLEQIKDLFEVTRNIKHVEVGAMVTTNKLLEIGTLAFNDLLLNTLSNTATHIIRNQITIGGALATKNVRYSLPGTLICMGSSVEVIDFSKNKSITKQVPVEKLYKNSELLLEKDTLIKKIKIPLNRYDFERFYCIEDPIKQKDSSVIFAFRANINQTLLQDVKVVITFPKAGIHISSVVTAELDGVEIPVIPRNALSISSKLVDEIEKDLKGVTPLQKERARRILQSVLYQLTPSRIFVKNTN